MRYSFTLHFSCDGAEVSRHWIETHLPSQHFGHRDLRMGPGDAFTLDYSELHAPSAHAARDDTIALIKLAVPFATCSNPGDVPRLIPGWNDEQASGPW